MNRSCAGMTAKEYLSQAYRIEVRINSKLEQAASLRELATKATIALSDMPRSSSPSLQSMEQSIIKMVDLENEINAEIDLLIDTKRDIMRAIGCIQNPEHQALLELRYLCFKPWSEISSIMGYDERWIFRLHAKALSQFPVKECSIGKK